MFGQSGKELKILFLFQLPPESRLQSIALLSMLPQQYSGVQRTLSKDDTRSVPRATKRLVHLQSLDLMGCKRVTDAGIAHLKGLTHLRRLDISWCSAITDAGIAHLKDLTQLEIIR